MAYKFQPIITSLATAVLLAIGLETGCASTKQVDDLARCLPGAESVYFASGQVWRQMNQPKSKNRAFLQMTSPLWSLKRLLEEGGIVVDSDSVEHLFVGARNFHAPPYLGPVLSDTLYVVRLRNADAVQLPSQHRCRICDSAGAEFWQWEALLARGDAKQSVFGARQGRLLFVSTSKDLATQALNGQAVVPVPTEIGNLVKSSRRLWGVRLYSGKEYKDKLASGLRIRQHEIGEDGLWTLFEVRTDGVIVVRHAAKPSSKGPLIEFEESDRKAKALIDGTWELEVALGNGDQDVKNALAIMSLFGFGIYL